MSADTVKFALSLSVVLVLVYGLTDGYIITVGSKRFPVGSPSWMDGPKTSVEESPFTVQGTTPFDNRDWYQVVQRNAWFDSGYKFMSTIQGTRRFQRLQLFPH